MENVLLQLADAADYPAFCAGQDGEILYANRAAEEQWPVWQGCTLPELLPEFFAGGEYRPYFRYFGSCHIFSALGGWKLEVLRFKDAFFCRVLPESQLEGLPESWAEDELERIRTEVLSIVRQRSSIEDILLDENVTVEQIYLPLTDILSAGDSSCRRISLSCNRLEAGRLNPERYPPQQVDLTDALSRLVHEIRVELPGLKAPVRAELPDYPVVARLSWPLLRRAILETIRCSEGLSQEKEGSTVFGITLTAERENAVVTLSDNYSGLPSPENPGKDGNPPYRSWAYARRLVEMMGGTLKMSETPYGDRAMEMRFPLSDEALPRSAKVLTFRSENGYRLSDRMVLSDPMIYLENFSD